MRRTDKYPETDCFIYFNANPHNRMGGDCVVRAISTALDMPWETTVRELTEFGIKHGYVLNDKKCYEKYLATKGWIKHKQPRKDDNTKLTGEEWCEHITHTSKYHRVGNIICNIGGHHAVAIIPVDDTYKVHDIWDSSDGCIGNYWTKYPENI